MYASYLGQVATLTSDWLQYGALGLLAILIVIVGRYIKDRDRFMQDMISRAEAKDEARIRAWQEMLRLAIETQSKTSDAMNSVCVRLDVIDERSTNRHKELMYMIDTLRNIDAPRHPRRGSTTDGET